MYDIHCHILPDLDDGPKTLESALEMARIAVADGVQTIIATPHGDHVAARGGWPALEQRVSAFRQAMAENNIPLKVLTGVEYVLTADLLRNTQEGRAVTLNSSRYILVEIDFSQWPLYTEEALFQLQLTGFTPVLAHPERQANIQQSPELLRRLVERGVLAEATAGSFLGDFGEAAKASAEVLLQRGLLHCIASDGHSPDPRRRPPVMAEAMKSVAKLAGEETAHLLAVTNPLAVLEGKPVAVPGPKHPARAKRFLWFGRG
ncbi:MAG: protein-tyrosine-phosphatase [Chloroflexi bacterium]|nr:protein-tyrosine-phosphatase [Chloroflexota bacterium]